MKSYRLLCLSLLLCFVFPILSYADQLEDAKLAIQNKNFEKACELLGSLTEENNAEAQFLLGSLYINGQGVEKDDTKGLSWIMKAARQGYVKARLRAVSIYLELANRGDTSAMHNLGYMCLHGWGGEQEPNVCIGWLERAAVSGHVSSAKVLSGIYEKGTFGITPDEEKAAYWSNLPAEFPTGIEGGLQTNPIFDNDAKEYILEDITVIGERSLRPLRREWFKAEDFKFELFNSLNSTDEFDITCERRSSTGSIISRRVCDVGYMKKARAEDARFLMEYMQDSTVGSSYEGFLPRSDEQLAVEFAYKAEALKKEMVELASKHPALAKAMLDENELKQRYILEQREKFKNSIMIGHPEPEEYFGDELKFLNLAYLAHRTGMMEEEIWSYWDKRLRSVIHQEPYRSIWLSSNTNTYAVQFVAYVKRILSGG